MPSYEIERAYSRRLQMILIVAGIAFFILTAFLLRRFPAPTSINAELAFTTCEARLQLDGNGDRVLVIPIDRCAEKKQ